MTMSDRVFTGTSASSPGNSLAANERVHAISHGSTKLQVTDFNEDTKLLKVVNGACIVRKKTKEVKLLRNGEETVISKNDRVQLMGSNRELRFDRAGKPGVKAVNRGNVTVSTDIGSTNSVSGARVR